MTSEETIKSNGNYSQDVEQAFWLEIDELGRRMLLMCRDGQGTPAIREAAEAMRPAQQILEAERGRRQLAVTRYELLSSPPE